MCKCVQIYGADVCASKVVDQKEEEEEKAHTEPNKKVESGRKIGKYADRKKSDR